MSNQSEVTVITTIEITDIFKVSSDEENVQAEIDKELKKLRKAVMRLSALNGVCRIEEKQTKIFPNVKTEK